MAKATAICRCKTCGEKFEVTAIKYNRKEADSWEEWASAHFDECTECWKTRKQEERDAENAKNAEMATADGWVELKGSVKQIAWANSIRAEMIKEIRKAIESKAENPEEQEAWKTVLTKATTMIDDAKWYIDNRNAGFNRNAMAIYNMQ